MSMARPESTATHIGPFLKHVRTSVGLSLRDAAKVGHVNFTYLAQVEREEKNPSAEWITAYMQGLGVEMAQRQDAAS
jgi:transcriptional regulator with XRE-family HTH domain